MFTLAFTDKMTKKCYCHQETTGTKVFMNQKSLSPISLPTGPRSAVGNVSGYRCEADCRSRGREFDPGPVPYFRGD